MVDDYDEKEERPVIYADVNPHEAGWDAIIALRGKYRFRVFFENDIGFKNGFQLDILRGWLEDKCGVEGVDWVLQPSEFDMEQLWNRSQDDDDRRLYGNSVYLTDVSWLVSEKLIQDPNSSTVAVDTKHTSGRITVVQTRT